VQQPLCLQRGGSFERQALFHEEAKLNTDGFRTFIDGLAERFEASFNVGPTSCFEADF
jgi:hypothetical protein